MMGTRSKLIMRLAQSKKDGVLSSSNLVTRENPNSRTVNDVEIVDDPETTQTHLHRSESTSSSFLSTTVARNNPDLKTVDDNDTVDDQQTTQTHCHRSILKSSSSSSSCSSSSSSSSFSEDSDDSVQDPDYKEVQEKRRRVFSLNGLFDDAPTATTSQQTTNQAGRSDNDSVIFTSDEIPINAPNAIITENQSPPIEARVVTDVSDDVPTAVTSQQTTNQEERSGIESIFFTSDEILIGVPNAIRTENQSPPIEARVVTVTESENPPTIVETPIKKGKKRPRQEKKWKKNIAKKMRNSGKSYKSAKTHKDIPERRLKPPCKETCKFKCHANITEIQRQQLLKEYWDLGEIERQWSFIIQSMEEVKPPQRYVRIDSDGTIAPKRDNNNAYFFIVDGVKIRVCKTFFKNTLDINNRPIETAQKKKNKNTNISLIKDNRGCHKNHAHVDDTIKTGVKAFIEAIPKIESHYLRANSKRHYIDGSKTISDIHRDYVEHCKAQNIPYANYIMFYRIFTQDFNISFFIPKKDACEVCEAYKLSTDEEKEKRKEQFLSHLEEKRMSRIEKEKDKTDEDIFVAVFDLQAVFQCPKGDTSVFYYKSKLNVLNLTIYDLKTNSVESYVWDEAQAHRGVNEIATCVFQYLKKISEGQNAMNIVFYSDNCAGQQKNKFMIAMYLYAVQNLPNINSITHKFLIKGHTQNEGDSAHSQIERQVKRQLRSGPIFTPEGFIGAIKAARKKSEPIHVNELCYSDIYDWKAVLNQMNFAIHKDEDQKVIKTSEIKGIRVLKDDPHAIYYRTSYADEMKRAVVIKKKPANVIQLKNAYITKLGLADKKKEDLLSLLNGNHIPGYYRAFYESL